MLVATSNDASSGLRRRCSTATINIDMMALMLCPSFRTIRTDFIGVFLCLQCYIAVAIHDEEGRCGCGGHPKSGLIRTDTTL